MPALVTFPVVSREFPSFRALPRPIRALTNQYQHRTCPNHRLTSYDDVAQVDDCPRRLIDKVHAAGRRAPEGTDHFLIAGRHAESHIAKSRWE